MSWVGAKTYGSVWPVDQTADWWRGEIHHTTKTKVITNEVSNIEFLANCAVGIRARNPVNIAVLLSPIKLKAPMLEAIVPISGLEKRRCPIGGTKYAENGAANTGTQVRDGR